MLAGTVVFASASYILMVIAFYMARFRKFHVSVMITIMLTDLFFPVYLFMTRDWYRRLIEDEEILSFLIWMHLIVIITLYMLYVVQIIAGRKILTGNAKARLDHRTQAKGILIARALVIITGALLVEPEAALS
ncbi:MAG: hypothetical protein ACE5EH_07445 [Gammaproteobacteria bacterium]